MIKAEYTKYLTDSSFASIKYALQERQSNLNEKLITENKDLLIKVGEAGKITKFHEYSMLYEMASTLRKQWNNGTVLRTYFFGGNKKLNKQVLDIASEWGVHCGIKFSETFKIEEAQIRVAFKKGGSWSYIGTDALGVRSQEPTINFGWLEEADDKEFKRVVLHEFGHVLGLIHEHQSPAIKIPWNLPMVYWYYNVFEGWDSQTTFHNVIWEADQAETNYSEVDTKSIMAYYIPPELVIGGKEIFPLNHELSEMDQEHIGKIYPLK